MMHKRGEFAELVSYDGQTGMWKLNFLGKEPSVGYLCAREADCSFAYQLHPKRLNGTMFAKGAHPDIREDQLGRKLVATDSFHRGEAMFIDFPSIVVSNDKSHRCQMRWRAHCDMVARARDDAAHKLLLETFDSMPMIDSSSEMVDGEHVRSRAVRIVSQRFDSNAHESDSNGNVSGCRGECIALYPYTALMNHSCDPSVTIEPGKLGGAQARLHIRCNRDVLHSGEELTVNYGPAALVTEMTLAQRRDYMQSHHQFTCQCHRCIDEGRRLPSSINR